MNAIDTNVLVYVIDSHEPAKQAKARDLLNRLSSVSETVLLWQVTCEYLSCLQRFTAAGRFPADDIEADILDFIRHLSLSCRPKTPFRDRCHSCPATVCRIGIASWSPLVSKPESIRSTPKISMPA